MIKNILLSFALLLVFSGIASAAEKSKILVAVFSRAGDNYSVGVIKEGNTMIVAKIIAEYLGADLFEIRTAKPYPANYRATTNQAKKEQNTNARPELAEDKDISEYDTIFFGYPNWWGDLPMVIHTFIEAHDFSGKTIIPFCTHEGGGFTGERTLSRKLTGVTMLKGFSIRGTTAQNSREKTRQSVISWLKDLGY